MQLILSAILYSVNYSVYLQILLEVVVKKGDELMIMGLNQPYFMPYIGFWQLVNAVDVFIIGDDYHYINRGWVNRNRVLQAGQAKYFNIEVDHASQNKLINELSLSNVFDPEKKLYQLRVLYYNAPYFQRGYELMQQILMNSEKNLAYFLEYSMQCVCDYLDIQTKFLRSSQIPHNSEYKKEYRILSNANMLEQIVTLMLWVGRSCIHINNSVSRESNWDSFKQMIYSISSSGMTLSPICLLLM